MATMRWRSNWFIGLCILAIVICVAWALGPDFIAAARSYTWKATPCEILRSQVAEEPFSSTVIHFVLRVEYSYEFNGKTHRSTRFTTGEHQGSTDVRKAERASVRFAPGTRATCFVNPRNPAEAVLERGELWGGIFLLAPFLIIGLIMHEQIFGWFEQRRWRKRKLKNVPLTETNDALRPDGRFILFGCIGLVMGLFFLGILPGRSALVLVAIALLDSHLGYDHPMRDDHRVWSAWTDISSAAHLRIRFSRTPLSIGSEKLRPGSG